MFSAGPRPPDLVSAGALLFHSFSLLASSMGHETESYGHDVCPRVKEKVPGLR